MSDMRGMSEGAPRSTPHEISMPSRMARVLAVPLLVVACGGGRPAELPPAGDIVNPSHVGEPDSSSGQPKIETFPTPVNPVGPAEGDGIPNSEPSKIPGQLDSLVESVKTMPQSFNPKRTQEEFQNDKRNIDVPAKAATEALKNGNKNEASKSLNELKAAVGALGNPLNEAFIPKSVRDAVDPQGQVLKSTDAVDPAVRDMYLEVVKMQLALLAGSGA